MIIKLSNDEKNLLKQYREAAQDLCELHALLKEAGFEPVDIVGLQNINSIRVSKRFDVTSWSDLK